MKKILLIIALMMMASMSLSAKRFIIRDEIGVIRTYYVTPSFLDKFADFVRQQDAESRPFLADIYRDLKKPGDDIIYNVDYNTIEGLDMDHWESMTPKEAKKMYGRATAFDATFNTKKQRFYKALECLKWFR